MQALGPGVDSCNMKQGIGNSQTLHLLCLQWLLIEYAVFLKESDDPRYSKVPVIPTGWEMSNKSIIKKVQYEERATIAKIAEYLWPR